MQKIYAANSKWLDFSQFYIMGILNATPDSFSDGGNYVTLKEQIQHFEKLIHEGANIIDIGGQSTRPFAQRFSAEEEWQRIEPILNWAYKNCPKEILISVDTFYSENAQKALDLGVNIINDVLGEEYEKMIMLCKQYKASYILMHCQGNPQTMQINPTYHDVVQEVYQFFLEKIQFAYNFNFYELIIDLGFGFGKTLEHNYQLFNNIQIFQNFNLPILVGISRKSMISKFFQQSWKELIPIQESLHMELIQKGVNILRVHEPLWVKKIYELMKWRENLG